MIKAIINTDQKGFYFNHKGTKHYLSDIDNHGYDTTCFTNAGYFGGFILTDIEYGINDYAILEVL